MSDFMDKLKKNAFMAKDEAFKFGRHVWNQAENMVDRTKVNIAINDTESKINDIYAEIGEKIYSHYNNGDFTEEEIEDKCKKIDSLAEEMNALKEKLAELKKTVKCPNCGEYNDEGNKFCSKCGNTMPARESSTADSDSDDDTVRRVVTIKPQKPETDDSSDDDNEIFD